MHVYVCVGCEYMCLWVGERAQLNVCLRVFMAVGMTVCESVFITVCALRLYAHAAVTWWECTWQCPRVHLCV